MKRLLIIGAGGHGKVVAEIAEDLGYEEIAFLDDKNSKAIGKTFEFEKFKDKYNEAFVGIGNNKLRSKLIQGLQKCGYTVPALIHPSAFVSQSAIIGAGTVVEPKAIVNANSYIAEGVIISIGAIIDHNAEVGKYAHINSGAIVKAGGKVGHFKKLESGEIVLGYESTRVMR